MTLAAIFAFLLASGACAQTTFQGEDGVRLEVIVCPRMVAPEASEDPQPEPPKRAT